MIEIEGDRKKWKDIQCSWIGRISIIKMYRLPKMTDRFNAICQNPYNMFPTTQTNKKHKLLKYIYNHRRPQ